MRSVLSRATLALFLVACGESTPPAVPTTLLLSPASVTLDAIGATQAISVTVKDQHDRPMVNVPITWLSSAPTTAAVTTTTATTPTATITATANGAVTIKVNAGAATANLPVTVAQIPTAFQKSGGDLQVGTVAQQLGAPLRVLVQDRLGVPISGQQVAFAVTQGGGGVSAATAITAADGTATTTFTLGTSTAATHEVTATLAGVSTPVRFTATATPGAPASVSAFAGNNQTAQVGAAVPTPPAAVVIDTYSNRVGGVPVIFAAGAGAGVVGNPTAITNTDGMASAGTWTLGNNIGQKTLTATVAGLPPATFVATAIAGPLAAFVSVAGNGQTALPGAAVPVLPAVRASDNLGNPVAGLAVTFTVASGGGTATGTLQTTGANGIATVGSWTLGSATGTNTLFVSVPGAPAVLFTATASTTPAQGTVSANAGNNQAAMAGTPVPIAPAIRLVNAGGAPVAGQAVTFAVTGGGGSVAGGSAITDANGVAAVTSWTLGSVAAPNTLTASVVGGGATGDPVVFTATGCSGGGGTGYAITLCFTTSMTPSQRTAFETAAARWGAIITSDVPDFPASIPAGSCGNNSPRVAMTIDDLVIFAAVENIDGPGNVLGSAGWCVRRSPGLPMLGTMRFDVADVANLEATNRFGSVILHEMGHVLGFGTLWSTLGLLRNSSPVGGPPIDTYFSGAGAIAAFDAAGGATYTGGLKVPVENMFGSGTINAHWREAVLANEIMTGFVNSGVNPLSEISIRAMEDLGYTVSTATADPFFLTLALRASAAADLTASPLTDDTYSGPLFAIDASGRMVRIR